jgi:hypothetical protein
MCGCKEETRIQTDASRQEAIRDSIDEATTSRKGSTQEGCISIGHADLMLLILIFLNKFRANCTLDFSGNSTPQKANF